VQQSTETSEQPTKQMINGFEISRKSQIALLTKTTELRKTLQVLDQITITCRLGAGANAEVSLGKLASEPPQEVAIKSVSMSEGKSFEISLDPTVPHVVKKTISFQKSGYSRLLNEIRLLSKISAPYVVKFIGVTVEAKIGLLKCVIEYCPKGSLANFLPELSKTSYHNLLKIAYQIASGLVVIHAAEIIHGDLKPGNVLIGPDGRIRIADFGVSLVTENGKIEIKQIKEIGGTYLYMSPEQLDICNEFSSDKPVTLTTAVDIYSLALIINELFSGKRPYAGIEDEEILIQVVSQKSYRDQVSSKCSKRVKNLIRMSWSQDPKNRHSAQKLCDELKTDSTNPDIDLDSAATFDDNKSQPNFF
jgi:serine/threonine protein kinase